MKRRADGKKAGVKRLFENFTKVSPEQWKKAVAKTLKGAGYEKLVWKPEGDELPIEPFYCAENLAGLKLFPAPAPGNFPFTRKSSRWKICEDIPPSAAARAAKLARAGVEGGAERVLFGNKKPATAKEVEKLLSAIDLSKTGVCFATADSATATALAGLFSGKTGVKPDGFALCDPLGGALDGKSGGTETGKLAKILPAFEKSFPDYGLIGVCGGRFRDAGADIVEETAMSLALGAEYLVRLGEKGVCVDTAARAMVFHFPVGTVFFPEIAKLRAARAVWAHIVERFDAKVSGEMKIHASSSAVNKSVCDPEVNILRSAVEAMAAVFGGCDSLSIRAFDGRYETGAAKSQTVARNTQLILREECELNKVADPCAGSYYVDTLTEKIARAALSFFQEIEKRGGFLKCAESGFLTNRLRESRKARMEKIAAGAETLTGVNKYPIEGERVLDRLKKTDTATAAADFERLRAATERHANKKGGKFPSVFPIKTGDPAISSARAVFSTNFFATAGFKIESGGVFNSATQAAKAAAKSRADVYVICCEDAKHPEFAPAFVSAARKKVKNPVVVVAGDLEKEDTEKYAGVFEFINTRSNVLGALKRIQKAVGIVTR